MLPALYPCGGAIIIIIVRKKEVYGEQKHTSYVKLKFSERRKLHNGPVWLMKGLTVTCVLELSVFSNGAEVVMKRINSEYHSIFSSL